MPSGKTHTRLNLFSLPILIFLFASYGITSSVVLLWFTCGFLIGTYFLSPDLDTRSAPYMKWGLLRIFWYPYQKIMPHRSKLTHSFIIGDLVRIAYLLLVFSPFLYIGNQKWDGQLVKFAGQHLSILFIIIVGIITASSIHILADILNTKRKRLLHGKSRRKF